MARNVEERVVEMRFDNKDFEKNIDQSIQSLERLNKSLKLEESGKSFDELGKAGKEFSKIDLTGPFKAAREQMSLTGTFVNQAVRNIENRVDQALQKIGMSIKMFTTDPIKDGFDEYELKMGSVQTIMAGTGESLATVNKYLDELNHYADKTIYSFSDMTSNIGKFTNAGVKLEDAVKAIQGVSNEAAISGANANEASRAMYNFAQALSAGYVKLIDWKSIENANMATKEFKEQLIETAAAMGKVTKVGNKYQSTTTNLQGKVSDLFDATANFNDSLAHQWMTTEVLTQTLANYATDVRDMSKEEKKAYEEKLRSIGYTEEQIEKIEELGQKAFDAAQDVKTFTQLLDTIKEALGSGWARTWELIFGDFNEAKALWTEISQAVGGFVDRMSDARNEVFQTWHDLGGRLALLDTVKTLINNLLEPLRQIKAGFQSIVPPITGNMLMDLTIKLNNFVHHLGFSNTALELFRRLGMLVGVIVKALGKTISTTVDIIKPIAEILNTIGGAILKVILFLVLLGEELLKTTSFTEGVKAVLETIGAVIWTVIKIAGVVKDFIDQAMDLPIVQTIIDDLKSSFKSLGDMALPVVIILGSYLQDFFDKLKGFSDGDYIQNGITKLDTALTNLYWSMKSGQGLVKSFFGLFQNDGTSFKDKVYAMGDSILRFNSNVQGTFDNNGAFPLLTKLSTGLNGFSETLDGVKGYVKDAIEQGAIAKSFIVIFSASLIAAFIGVSRAADVFRRAFVGIPGFIAQLTNATKAMVAQVKAQAMLKVVGAIIALCGALALMTMLDPVRLVAAAAAIGIVSVALFKITSMLGNFASADGLKNFHKGAVMMVSMAGSLLILAMAFKTLEGTEFGSGLAAKLVTIIGLMAALATTITLMSRFSKKFRAGATMVLAFSFSLGLVVDALKKLEDINLDNIDKTLPVLLKVMVALGAVNAMSSFISPFAGIGFLGIVAGILVLEQGLEKLSNLPYENLKKIQDTLDFISSVVSGLVVLFGVAAIIKSLALAAESIRINLIDVAQSLSNGIVSAVSTFQKGVLKVAKNLSFAADVIAIALAFVAIGLTIQKLGEMPIDQMKQGLIGAVLISTILISLYGLLTILSHLAGSAITGIAGIGIAAAGLAIAVDLLSELKTNLIPALFVVSTLAVIVGLMEYFLTGMAAIQETQKKALVSLNGMIGVIAALTLCVTLLSFVDWHDLIAPTVTMGVFLLGLDFAFKYLGAVKTGPALAAAGGIVGVLIALTAAFYVLKDFDGEAMQQQAIALGVALLELSVAFIVLSKIETVAAAGAAAALIGIGLALVILAVGCKAMEYIDTQKMSEGLIGLAGALIIMAVAATTFGVFIEIMGPGALVLLTLSVALLVCAAAVNVFALGMQFLLPILQELQNVSLGEIAKGLAEVGGASLIFSLAAMGVLFMAVALGAFDLAIAPLSEILPKFADGLTKTKDALVSFKDADFSGLTGKIIEFGLAVGELDLVAPTVSRVSKAFADSSYDFEEFSESIGVLAQNITGLGEVMSIYEPKIENALTAIGDIASRISSIEADLESLGAGVIDQLMTDLNTYSDTQMPSTGMTAIGHFCEGFREGIDSEMPGLAQDLADGLTQTIQDHEQAFYNSGYDALKMWVQGAHDGSESQSPSEATARIGGYLYEGVANKTEDLEDSYYDSGFAAMDKWVEGAKDGAGTHSESVIMNDIAVDLKDGAVNETERHLGEYEASGASAGNSWISGFASVVNSFASNLGGMGFFDKVTGLFTSDGAKKFLSDVKTEGKNLLGSIFGNKTSEEGNIVERTIGKVTEKVEEYTSTVFDADGALADFKKQQEEATEAAKEAAKAAADEATAAAEEAAATTGAGKAAGSAAKEDKDLEKALKALYMSTDVFAKEYGDLLDQLGETDHIAGAQKAFEQLGMTVEEFGDRWTGVYDAASSALSNIFDEASDRGYIAKEAILKNMRENLNQVSQWADSMGRLAERGIDKGLYEKLEDLGPDGYKYVHAFMEMTDEELSQAGDMYTEALTLPTAAANRVMSGAMLAGSNFVQGFQNGLDINELGETALEGADTIVENFAEGLGEHSPSVYGDEDGWYLMVGINNGILRGLSMLEEIIGIVTNRIIMAFQKGLNEEKTKAIGQKIIETIATGMELSDETLSEIILQVVNNISQAITKKADQIIQNGREICENLVKGFADEMAENQVKVIDETIDVMADEIVDEFEVSDNESKFIDMVAWLVQTLCDEILNEKTTFSTFEETFKALIDLIYENLTSSEYEEQWKNIGKFWVEGLAAGITENAEIATSAAEALADSLPSVTGDRLEVASPSKVAKQIGEYWDEGLAIGINNLADYPINSAKKIAAGIVSITKKTMPNIAKTVKGLMTSTLNMNQLAKSLASSTGKIQIASVTNGIAKAFVPISQMAEKVSDSAAKSVRKIEFNVSKSGKNVEKTIKNALKFARQLNTNINGYDSPDGLIDNLFKVGKYFGNVKKAPKSVVTFLQNIRSETEEMRPIIKTYIKAFGDGNTKLKELTSSSVEAYEAAFTLASSIYEDTEAYKNYSKTLEKVQELEEELTEAKEAEESGKERSSTAKSIEEIESELHSAKKELVSFTKMLSQAMKEYTESIKESVISAQNVFEQFSVETSKSSSEMLSNIASNLKGTKNWGNLMVKAAKKGLNEETMKQLLDMGIDSSDIVESFTKMSEKDVAIWNDYVNKQQKIAEKAAKKAVAAVAKSTSKEVKKAQKKIIDSLSAGDKLWQQTLAGDEAGMKYTLQQWGSTMSLTAADIARSSALIDEKFANQIIANTRKNLTDLLDHVKSEMAPVADIINGYSNALWGNNDAIYQNGEQTAHAAVAVMNFGEFVRGMGEDVGDATTYLGQITNSILSFNQGLRDTWNIGNPFEEFSYDMELTASKIVSNMQSQISSRYSASGMAAQLFDKGFSKEAIYWISKQDTSTQYAILKEAMTMDPVEVNSINEMAKDAGSNAVESVVKGFDYALNRAVNDSSISDLVASQANALKNNAGYKLIKQIIGNDFRSEVANTANAFGKGSSEFNYYLNAVKKNVKPLESAINLAGQKVYGLTKAYDQNESETMQLANAVGSLGEVFGVIAEDGEDTAAYITRCTEAMIEWKASVVSAATAQSPFAKFSQDAALSKDQILYNMNSQKQALLDFADMIDEMQQKGFGPEVLKYFYELGPQAALAYRDAFNEMSDAEVGYVNDTYKQVTKTLPEQIGESATAAMLATATDMGKAIIDGVNKAFEENGVDIPLTDPEAAEEQGYQEGYMLVTGVADGIGDNQPQLVNATTSAITSAANAISNSDAVQSVSNAVSSGIVQGTTEAVSESVAEALTTTTDKIKEQVESISSMIRSVMVTAIRIGLQETTTDFNEAIAKIQGIINSIDDEYVIHVTADTSKADEALNALNARIAAIAYSANVTQRAFNGAQIAKLASAGGNNQNGSENQAKDTVINYTQNNYSPESLSPAQIYRQTNAQLNAFKNILSVRGAGI